MSRPHFFRTITERLPHRDRNPAPEDTSAQLYAELETYTYDDAHYRLSESIDMLENLRATVAPHQLGALQEVVVSDAYALACRALSEEMVDLLELQPAYPDDVSFEHSETVQLRTLYLLVHAYDQTGDKKLRHVVEYIFSEAPPDLSDNLAKAYQHSRSEGSSILSEYQRLAAREDDQLDADAGYTPMEPAHTAAMAAPVDTVQW